MFYLIGDFYKFYFILAFAALHGNILHKASGKETYIDVTIVLNYIFMTVVVSMLGIIIFIKNPIAALSDLFFRLLGANAIIDGTMSILVIILYKLHLHNNTKQENPLENSWGYTEQNVPQNKRSGLSIFVWILIAYLIFQIFLGVFIRSFFRLF
jgi:hypothetical protein